jgi:hypothetical protein
VKQAVHSREKHWGLAKRVYGDVRCLISVAFLGHGACGMTLDLKIAKLTGCPHSSHTPNPACRIRVKASSMARKRLPSV